MKFIFPRVLALTAIVGLATLVLGMLFKLLIGATLIAGIVTIARRQFRKHGMGPRGLGPMGYGNNMPMAGNKGVSPFQAPWQRAGSNSSIIPIN